MVFLKWGRRHGGLQMLVIILVLLTVEGLTFCGADEEASEGSNLINENDYKTDSLAECAKEEHPIQSVNHKLNLIESGLQEIVLRLNLLIVAKRMEQKMNEILAFEVLTFLGVFCVLSLLCLLALSLATGAGAVRVVVRRV